MRRLCVHLHIPRVHVPRRYSAALASFVRPLAHPTCSRSTSIHTSANRHRDASLVRATCIHTTRVCKPTPSLSAALLQLAIPAQQCVPLAYTPHVYANRHRHERGSVAVGDSCHLHTHHTCMQTDTVTERGSVAVGDSCAATGDATLRAAG